MVNITCPNLECGVVFGVPDHVFSQARQHPTRLIHCPNGHDCSYKEPESVRLQARIEELTRRLDAEEQRSARHLATARYWQGIAHRKRKS